MDYNQNQQSGNRGMTIASLVLGIASIVMCCTGILSLPLGAIGVILAVLTKRKGRAMPGMSIAGMATSIIGMILGLIMCIYVVVSSLAMIDDPAFQQYMDSIYEEAYGMTFEEYMEYYGYPID